MARITVKPITREDVIPVVRMELQPPQDDFVSPNAVSLAQVHYEGGGYPFVIRADGERVGFIQVIDLSECHNRQAHENPSSVYLWRFMIIPERQGQGIGKRAMQWLERWTRDRGHSEITLTCAPENETAIGLYESCGYKKTGRIDDGEIELRKII